LPFSDDQIRRYARQMVLPEVGGIGQARLGAATVTASSELEAIYLRAAGVGEVKVIAGGDDGVEAASLRALATLQEILEL
jgi:molybdopterin-synthase adenylyltransferase